MTIPVVCKLRDLLSSLPQAAHWGTDYDWVINTDACCLGCSGFFSPQWCESWEFILTSGGGSSWHWSHKMIGHHNQMKPRLSLSAASQMDNIYHKQLRWDVEQQEGWLKLLLLFAFRAVYHCNLLTGDCKNLKFDTRLVFNTLVFVWPSLWKSVHLDQYVYTRNLVALKNQVAQGIKQWVLFLCWCRAQSAAAHRYFVAVHIDYFLHCASLMSWWLTLHYSEWSGAVEGVAMPIQQHTAILVPRND